MFYDGLDATDGYEYRTDYRAIRCLPRSIYQISRSGTPVVNMQNLKLKLIVNLKRLDATADTQNILFVATYPITTKVTQFTSPTDPRFYSFVNVSGCSDVIIPPVQNSEVMTFCNSSTYKQPTRGFLRYAENLAILENVEREKSKIRDSIKKTLLHVYPYPVAESTNILYELPTKGRVKISISDAMNRDTKVLIQSETHEPGRFNLALDVTGYNAGIYFCTIETETGRQTQKIIISK